MHLSSDCRHTTGKLTSVDISADNFDSYFPKRLLKFFYTSSMNVLKLVVRRVLINVFSECSSFAPNYFNVR